MYGDIASIKLVAVEGNHDYAVYVGPTEWSDQDISERGMKLNEQQATPIMQTFAVQLIFEYSKQSNKMHRLPYRH